MYINILLTLQPAMSKKFKSYKLLFATSILLCVCMLSNTTDNFGFVSNPEINLNTKVVVSHITHTCSPANIETNDENEKTKEVTFALKENKYYSLVKTFGEGLERSSYRTNDFAQLSLYKRNVKNKVVHKSLHQIGVLLI